MKRIGICGVVVALGLVLGGGVGGVGFLRAEDAAVPAAVGVGEVEGYLAAAQPGAEGVAGRLYWVELNLWGMSGVVRVKDGEATFLTLKGNVVTGVFGPGVGAWAALDGDKREVRVEKGLRALFELTGEPGKARVNLGVENAEGKTAVKVDFKGMWAVPVEGEKCGSEVVESEGYLVFRRWDEKVQTVAIVGKKEKALRSLWVASRQGVPMISVVLLDEKAVNGERQDVEGVRKLVESSVGWAVKEGVEEKKTLEVNDFMKRHRAAFLMRGEVAMEREGLLGKVAGINLEAAKREYMGRIAEYWALLNEKKTPTDVKALLKNSVRLEMSQFTMEKGLEECFGGMFEKWNQGEGAPYLETVDAQEVYEQGAQMLKMRKDKRYQLGADVARRWLDGQSMTPDAMLGQKKVNIGVALLGLMDQEKRSALLLCAPMRVWMGGLEKRIEGTATVLLGGATRDWTSEDFLALLKDIQTHDGEEAAANFLVTFCYGNQEPSARYGGEAFVSYLIEKAPLMRKGPNVHFLLRAVEGSVTGKAREMFEQAVMDDALFSLDAVALAALAGDALRGRMGPASFRMRMGADLKKPLDAKDEDRVVNGFLSAGTDDSVVDDLAGVLMRTKDPMLATTVLDTFYFGLKNKTVTRKKVFERVREYVRKSDEPRMDRVLMMVDPELKPTLLEKMTGVKVSREMIAIARSKEWVLAHRAEVVGLLDDAIAGPK